MAHVIELFGAPGTGKSSLVAALDGRRVVDRRLISASRLLRVGRPLLGRVGPLPDRIRCRALSPSERRAVIDARREEWAPLLEQIAEGVAATCGSDGWRDPVRALYAPGWVVATLELRALADAAPDDVVVVLDEGLAQRAAIVCGAEASDDALVAYLARLPATTLHLQLVSDQEPLLARLRGRERVIARHIGRKESEVAAMTVVDLALAERVATALRSTGAPVARLRTDDALDRTLDVALERIADAIGAAA